MLTDEDKQCDAKNEFGFSIFQNQTN